MLWFARFPVVFRRSCLDPPDLIYLIHLVLHPTVPDSLLLPGGMPATPSSYNKSLTPSTRALLSVISVEEVARLKGVKFRPLIYSLKEGKS